MNIKNKLVLLLMSLFVLLTLKTAEVSAQAEDIYRTIISQKSHVNVEVPITKESSLIFNSLPVQSETKDSKKWFNREIDFTLGSRADFLNINFTDFPSPYSFGTLELHQKKDSRWDSIYKINILQPAIYINSINLDSGRYRVEFSFDDPDFHASKAAVAAYSYVSNVNSYDPTKTFIFTTSTSKLFGDSFWPLIKSRSILLVCEDTEPFLVFGDTCSLSNVEARGQWANVVIRGAERPLAVIPSWNHRVLLLSPKVFLEESRAKLINSFLSSWLESRDDGFSKDLGGGILDLYRSLSEKIWIWVFLVVTFLVLISIRILPLDRNFLNRVSARTLFIFPVNLLLSFVRKYRWLLILTFIVSSICFVVVFFSRDVLIFLLRDKNIENLYLGYKQGSSSSIAAVGIRHLLEVIFINISALAIFLAFSDRLFSPLGRYGTASLVFIGKRGRYLDILCVLLYTAALTARIVGIFPQLEVILLAVLLILLLIRELCLILGPVPVNTGVRYRWFFLLLFLVSLIPVSDRIRLKYYKGITPLIDGSALVAIDKDYGLQGIKLPLSPKPLPKNGDYGEFKVVPNGVLLAGKYLIWYPGVSKIYYAKDGYKLDDVANKRVALYFIESSTSGANQPDVLKSLSNYIVPGSFLATPASRLEVKLPHTFKSGADNYLFYTYLFRGENTFTINYTDLNFSPSPGRYTLNLMNEEGDIVESVTDLDSSDFQLGMSLEKKYSDSINVDIDGVYILELIFNGDPLSLGVRDHSIINSLNFPSDSVYYFDMSRIGTESRQTPIKYEGLNNLSIRNPFSFQLVSFGEDADVVLVPNSNFNLTIDSTKEVIDLGGVLTSLSRVNGDNKGLQVRYQDGSPLLFVSK